MPFRKILCPTDFSEPARQAFRAALELAASTGGAVSLFHVIRLPSYALSPNTAYPELDLLEELGAAADRFLREWQLAAEPLQIPIETGRVEGIPWDQIVRRAHEGRFDLVVMGTHGRTGLKHALLGSVAEKVVRHAACPVLVVRPQG